MVECGWGRYRPLYSPEVGLVERARRETAAKRRENTTLPLCHATHGHSRIAYGESFETVFEEVRRCVEGRVYGNIEAKKRAVEEVLSRLELEGRLSTLVGWAYIREAFQALHK